MALSWVQYAYGIFDGDVNLGGYWTVGPITGPAVIVEVRTVFSMNQFSTFTFGMSVVSSPAPTVANFDGGVKLQRPAVEASVATTEAFMDYSADGSNPWTLVWPCWVVIGTGPRWLCLFSDRVGGAANMRCMTAVRAERLWPDGAVPAEKSPAAARRVTSPLEVLRARARRG